MMKKFRFLLVVAIVLVSALALCLTASAADTVTAETYEQVYVGDYTSEETPSQEGVSYTGEAYIVFGKVTGGEQAGIILERYAVTDSGYATVLETKYFAAREGRVAANGEFGIALFNVADGYYQAKVVAGDYKNPTATGAAVKFSKGVDTYTVDFIIDGDTKVRYEVAAGGTVVPPVAEREGFMLAGWRSSNLDANLVETDQNHRSADWGETPESFPGYFTINTNRAYIARWIWVGENEDYAAPETMKVTITGYSKLSAKFDADASIPAGSVAVMSFDVLEDVSASGWASIGLTTINVGFWNLAANAYTGAQIFVPYDANGSIGEYTTDPTNIEGITSSTDVYMYPANVLKEGKSLIFVYKPYESDENPGYYRAYWKNTGSDDDYVLVAGWENLSAKQAIAGNMPCLATTGGKIIVPLKNFNISIDADGDYTTTDDWTDMGMGVAESCNDLRSASNSTGYNASRYVEIDTSYIHSSQYQYTFTDGVLSSNHNGVFVANGSVNGNNFDVDAGEYLEMRFTVISSNIDEMVQKEDNGNINMGFGLSHTNHCNNGWSGVHGYGLTIGLEDGETLVEANGGPGGNSWFDNCDTIEASGYGVGLKTLLQPGTEIVVRIALDLSDNGSNDGYEKVFYKTPDMDDFEIAAEMNFVGHQVAMSQRVIGTASDESYPIVYMSSGYAALDSTKLTLTIGSYSVATYDANDNVTSKIGLLQPSVSGNGGTTVISYPAN